MNVYDWDKTIYDGDSTTHFCLYELRKHPKNWRFVPGVIRTVIRLGRKFYEDPSFKESVYKFMGQTEDIDAEVLAFWADHRKNIQRWYLDRWRPDDLIISASSHVLLDPIMKELGVNIIASEVDKNTGKLLGPNNSGAEKVKRFREAYPDAEIEEFYSDSDHDLPMAKLAKKAFKVKRGRISPWEF